MRGKTEENNYLFDNLESMLDPKQPLFLLAKKIPWEEIITHFIKFYSETGRPAKNIRLMVSLILLKRIFNLGDETVVEQWLQNPYMQYFSGEKTFQWKMPCDPSDLVHFRKRIGNEGVEYLFQISISIHGDNVKKEEVSIDSTVQEKNISFPTDFKLHKKIIDKCNNIAAKEKIKQRQTCKRVIKSLIFAQRGMHSPTGRKKALKAQKKMKTYAGRLVRELRRKLNEEQLFLYAEELKIFEVILSQKRESKDKIYSIHEKETYCISKGKEHKKYEFGTKVSIAYTNKSGVIVGALNIPKNIHDSKTISETIDQIEKVAGFIPKKAGTDQGYRGISEYKDCKIIHADKLRRKTLSKYEKGKIKKLLRRRAGIEAIISSLKNHHRLSKNFLSGTYGNQINVLLSAAGFNLKKWMRLASFLFNIKLSAFLNFINAYKVVLSF